MRIFIECRTALLAATVLALVLACPAAPARAGFLPDIRGLNFGAYPGAFQGVLVIGGPVTIPGLGTTFFEDNPSRVAAPFAVYPGVSPNPVFSVVADPNNPNNPGRIDVQTGFGQSNSPLSEIRNFNLIGSYDQTTGALSVSGSMSGPTGSLLENEGVGVNLFGNGQDFQVILGFTSLTYSLHGTLTQGPNGLTITGTDPVVPLGGPGNIVISGTTFVYFNPVGDFNVADALLTGTVASGLGYGGLYNWTATAVPEPSSVAMTVVGLAGLAGVSLRRRLRRA